MKESPKEIIEECFTKAYPWYLEQKCRDPLNGFGKGPQWGAHILKNFMPIWFQKFVADLNWSPVCMCGGMKGFLFFAEGCGFKESVLWSSLCLYLDYHKQHTETEEKS